MGGADLDTASRTRAFAPAVPVQRIDWFRVITDLAGFGYTAQALATHVGVAKSTLLGWKQGAEPRYSEGECLVAFWCAAKASTRDQVPMVTPGDWRAYHAK